MVVRCKPPTPEYLWKRAGITIQRIILYISTKSWPPNSTRPPLVANIHVVTVIGVEDMLPGCGRVYSSFGGEHVFNPLTPLQSRSRKLSASSPIASTIAKGSAVRRNETGSSSRYLETHVLPRHSRGARTRKTSGYATENTDFTLKSKRRRYSALFLLFGLEGRLKCQMGRSRFPAIRVFGKPESFLMKHGSGQALKEMRIRLNSRTICCPQPVCSRAERRRSWPVHEAL
jgi:hypothetical protein